MRSVGTVLPHTNLNLTELEKKMKPTCEKNGGEDSYDKLMAAYNASKPCLKTYRMFVTPYSVYRTSLANCTVDTRKAMKDCFREEEKYYPDFVLEWMQSLFGFAYRNLDKLMPVRQPNMELVRCLIAVNEEESQKELLKCAQIVNDRNDTIIKVPPKPELCKKIKEFSVCFSNLVKYICVRDIQITKYIMDLTTAFETPCQNTTIENEA